LTGKVGWIKLPAQLTNEDTKMTYLIAYLIAGVVCMCFEIAAVPANHSINWRIAPAYIMLWLPIVAFKVVRFLKGTK
jgi:hypothetical protein